DAEAGPDLDRPGKYAGDLLRPGGGGDVVIGREEAEQLVADAAAGPEGFKARLAQSADDVHGELAVGHHVGSGRAERRQPPGAVITRRLTPLGSPLGHGNP